MKRISYNRRQVSLSSQESKVAVEAVDGGTSNGGLIEGINLMQHKKIDVWPVILPLTPQCDGRGLLGPLEKVAIFSEGTRCTDLWAGCHPLEAGLGKTEELELDQRHISIFD
jgi:hypothetical protein